MSWNERGKERGGGRGGRRERERERRRDSEGERTIIETAKPHVFTSYLFVSVL